MKSLHKGLLYGLLAGAIGGGTLLAQPAGGGGGDDASSKAEGAGNVTLKLSLTEMITRSGDLDKQVKTDLRHVKHLQEVARKQKDIIKLTCVNDKYLAMKAEANIFDNVRRELEGLLTDGSDDRNMLYPSVTKAAFTVHAARVEADACVGEGELSAESKNDVNDPGLDDPTLGDPFAGGVEPPGYASPYN